MELPKFHFKVNGFLNWKPHVQPRELTVCVAYCNTIEEAQKSAKEWLFANKFKSYGAEIIKVYLTEHIETIEQSNCINF